MKGKSKPVLGSLRLFIAGAVIIGCIGFVFLRTTRPGIPSCTDEIGNRPGAKANEPITLLRINEDSLNNLLNDFFRKHNIQHSVINSTGSIYHVIVKPFGANRIAFYNNPRVLLPNKQGFLVIETKEGGLECSFIRQKIGAAMYVEVPSDILFRLFQHKF